MELSIPGRDLIELPGETLEMETIEVPLDEREIKLAEYLAMGQRPVMIADFLGVSTAWVRVHRKDPRVAKLVQDLQQESLDHARKAIIHNTQAAAETIIESLDSTDARIRLAAAKDILDRGGIARPDPHALNNTVNILNFNNMSQEELRINILQRFKALELEE